jgi:hypothetical protein
MCESVLECVLQRREQARLVEELRRLKVSQADPQIFLREGIACSRACSLDGDRSQQGKRHILPDHRRGLEQPLLICRESVDPGRQDRLDRRRHTNARDLCCQPVGSSFADQRAGFDECADAFLQEERIALGPLDQELFQIVQEPGSAHALNSAIITDGAGRAQQRIEQRLGTVLSKRVDSDLRIVSLASPDVRVFRPIVDE